MLNFALTSPAPLDVFFVDDSRQAKPPRPGMGPLVATGGIGVEAERVGALNHAVEKLCRQKYGFPAEEEFKWSLPSTSWMRQKLTDDRRQKFFGELISVLAQHAVVALVMVVDEKYGGPSLDRAASARESVKFFLERVDKRGGRLGRQVLLVADRPGGGRREESAFVKTCTEIIEGGTEYVKLGHVAHGLLTADSHASRLLQVADVITSVTLSVVAGRTQYAEPLFKKITPLLHRSSEDRIHGYGLKIYPDSRYANLYYWLVGEETMWNGSVGYSLPMPTRPYGTNRMSE